MALLYSDSVGGSRKRVISQNLKLIWFESLAAQIYFRARMTKRYSARPFLVD